MRRGEFRLFFQVFADVIVRWQRLEMFANDFDVAEKPLHRIAMFTNRDDLHSSFATTGFLHGAVGDVVAIHPVFSENTGDSFSSVQDRSMHTTEDCAMCVNNVVVFPVNVNVHSPAKSPCRVVLEGDFAHVVLYFSVDLALHVDVAPVSYFCMHFSSEFGGSEGKGIDKHLSGKQKHCFFHVLSSNKTKTNQLSLLTFFHLSVLTFFVECEYSGTLISKLSIHPPLCARGVIPVF